MKHLNFIKKLMLVSVFLTTLLSFNTGQVNAQNTAIDFDGTNGQRVETGTMIPYNPTYTVMGWYYKKNYSSRIFSWGSPQVNKYVTLEFYNNQFRSYSPTQGEGKVQTSSAYPNNAWYHFAVVKDAGTVTIYIDGVVAASGAQSHTIAPTKTSMGAGLINNYWQGNGNGISDDLSVWDIALSQAEIVNYMSASPVGTESGIIANYDFDTPGVTPGGNNAGFTTLYDVSGNGYDGTLLNFPLNGSTGNWVDGYAPPVVEATWIGVAGNDWNTPSSWSTGVIPDANTNVIIPVVTSGDECHIRYDADCNNLTIEAGAWMIVENNPGNWQGTLINQGTVTINGVLGMAKMYDGNTIDWHLISSPMSGALSGVFTDEYLQWFDEPNNTYHEIIPVDVPLNVMQGYAIYSTEANNYFAFGGVGGNINYGDLSINVTNSGTAPHGWNLVGNPYTASLDWNAVIPGLSGINSSIYYLDAATGNWLTWNGTTGSGSQYVPPMQGFFVSASAASATLNVDNSMRSHNGALTFYKESPSNLLVLKAEGNGFEDKAYIHFNSEATQSFDGQFDAYKIFSEYNTELPQLYTLAGDDKLSINELPEPESMQAGFKANVNGEYTIGIEEQTDFLAITLEDVITGVFTNLLTGSYTFYYNTNDIESRFIIHFSPLSVNDLPANQYNIYSYKNEVNVISPEISEGSIRILNTMGQVVAEANLQSGSNKLTVNGSGTYIVQVVSSNGLQTKKVFIK